MTKWSVSPLQLCLYLYAPVVSQQWRFEHTMGAACGVDNGGGNRHQNNFIKCIKYTAVEFWNGLSYMSFIYLYTSMPPRFVYRPSPLVTLTFIGLLHTICNVMNFIYVLWVYIHIDSHHVLVDMWYVLLSSLRIWIQLHKLCQHCRHHPHFHHQHWHHHQVPQEKNTHLWKLTGNWERASKMYKVTTTLQIQQASRKLIK